MPRHANLTGAAFMVASMAGFAVEDMFVKAAVRHVPLGQILAVTGIVGAFVFAAMVRARGERLWHPAFLSRPILVRSLLEVGARLTYALAIVLTPLSVASAILQASPLVVVAGAALIFGERVSPARWAAIAAGFAGVLVILRPGLEGFDSLSLFAVAGTLGFAGRDLATRAAPKALTNLHLGVLGFIMLALAGLANLAWTGGARLPDGAGAALMAGATVFGMAGYFALTIAMRTGDVGAVTPFRYTRLVFAVILGVLVFGERPDLATVAGSVIVVASGLVALVWRRA